MCVCIYIHIMNSCLVKGKYIHTYIHIYIYIMNIQGKLSKSKKQF